MSLSTWPMVDIRPMHRFQQHGKVQVCQDCGRFQHIESSPWVLACTVPFFACLSYRGATAIEQWLPPRLSMQNDGILTLAFAHRPLPVVDTEGP